MDYQTYHLLAQTYAHQYSVAILDQEDSAKVVNTSFAPKKLRKRISFTPYIWNKCSAVCSFCSERINNLDIINRNPYMLSTDYYTKLAAILTDLQDVELFLSLSGMEPLENLKQVEQLLQCFAKYTQDGGVLTDCVIYSNLSAMAKQPDQVLHILKQYRVRRLETSRHHYDAEINQAIMHFRNDERVRQNDVYQTAISLLLPVVTVKLACVLQKKGINSVDEVVKYLLWAESMGISSLTFRELSILDDVANNNATVQYIRLNRVAIETILPLLPKTFKLERIVKGYYYFSFVYCYQGGIEVTFEVSDYEEMHKKHQSDVINKLIYYPNGDLCMDWNSLEKIR